MTETPSNTTTTETVHIAGPDIQIGSHVRQLCAWCGHKLIDYDLNNVAVPEGPNGSPGTWPRGALIAVDGRWAYVLGGDGSLVPPNSCSHTPT